MLAIIAVDSHSIAHAETEYTRSPIARSPASLEGDPKEKMTNDNIQMHLISNRFSAICTYRLTYLSNCFTVFLLN